MKKSQLRMLIGISALLYCASTFGGKSNCVFDPASVADTQLKSNKDVSSYLFDKESGEVRILAKNGALISIKRWACDHYGTHAVMLIGPYPRVNFGNLGEEFVRLTDVAVDGKEAGIVKNFIKKNILSAKGDTKQYNIPDSGYSEFFLRYSIAHDSVLLEIKFYRD